MICDTDTFSTLPEREVRSGSAEIIKYGVIGDEGFFESLGEEPISARYEAVVERCVSMKRDFVARDEFDRGDRRYLNFGHTIGHAAERCSGYTLPHGYAVAMGMARDKPRRGELRHKRKRYGGAYRENAQALWPADGDRLRAG